MPLDREDHATILLHDVPVTIRIGIAPKERRAPQRVLVSVELTALPPVGGYHTLDDTIDYNRVFRHLRDVWPTRPHTELLEQWLEDLFAFVFEDPRVVACRARILKPDVYPGTTVSGVESFRRRPTTASG